MQREDMELLVGRWQKAYTAAAGSSAPSEDCMRRAEYLLAELQRLGFTGRPAAVQAACKTLRGYEAGGHADVFFAAWHLLASS